MCLTQYWGLEILGKPNRLGPAFVELTGSRDVHINIMSETRHWGRDGGCGQGSIKEDSPGSKFRNKCHNKARER